MKKLIVGAVRGSLLFLAGVVVLAVVLSCAAGVVGLLVASLAFTAVVLGVFGVAAVVVLAGVMAVVILAAVSGGVKRIAEGVA